MGNFVDLSMLYGPKCVGLCHQTNYTHNIVYSFIQC